MGEKRDAYWLLVGKPEGKRPLGRPRLRLVDIIKTDIVEIGWGGVDWLDLARDRYMGMRNDNSGSIKCWETVAWPHNWWPLEQCSDP
jgi:hypothetical protein